MATRDPRYTSLLHSTLEHALTFLNHLDSRTVAATKTSSELRQAFARSLPDQGIPAEQVVEELARDTEGGLLGSASGRFFAWVIGGALPSALAADWLSSTWNQNAALYCCSPAAAIVEEVAGDWLKELLQLPSQASFALVTGSQMAHTTCLAAARNALLARVGWDVEERGLFGAPPIRILVSGERHGSVDRAVRLLGFGKSSLVALRTDRLGRIRVEALDRELQNEPAAPAILCLQAGDINSGAFDDFQTIVPLARRHSAWVHVDGAFGLWAFASPRYCHLMEGAQSADSWTTDGHKLLNVPYDCGYAFVADADAHRASMTLRASYLTHAADARDQMNWNPEWSRRGRGFPTYAALRELGRQGVADLVDRCCEHAQSLVQGLGRLPGVEVLCDPIINQGLVRFLAPSGTEPDHDRHTDQVIASTVEAGEAFFSGTTWRGRRAMRVSVCNWRTTSEDVRRTLQSVASVLQSRGTTAGAPVSRG
jgi:glutamate/tyrosine decarboxylase-like PLP-dependent enzyme